MAVGDAVVGMFTASGTFQPAAGVEVLITCLTPKVTGDIFYVYNGTYDSCVLVQDANGIFNGRLPITNSV